ncbi:DUF2190 family protein [Clostridium cellulovorans]|uniref:Uncharacterized protein n=1 Tax=Clostridium cellulovorans (strain ATCC 35296 / DSM 3052 / OCM 3 / 743B) TaxID=573061 RepID=D9SVZ5_CLOC7|nr:DUF2190 family protein [Clostridium cellulovorans]ADL53206.1 hypothetical protein Clocel_3530 [Clostridium cellulovorans 743B]
MRTINIKVDSYSQNYDYRECVQNDDLTLKLTLTENGVPHNLVGNTLMLNWIKPDNTIAIVSGDNISFIDNIVTVVLPRDCTRAAGVAKFELVITNASKQETTFQLSLNINGSVLQNQEISSNTATVIEELGIANDNANITYENLLQAIQGGDILSLKALERNIIYVHKTITEEINNHPVYPNLKTAVESISDNGVNKRYVIYVFPGLYEEDINITLKDYVDIEALKDWRTDTTTISYSCPANNNMLYDILRTNPAPVGIPIHSAPLADFAIHCKIKGICFKIKDGNYCVHLDFNKNSDINITFEDCQFWHLGNTSSTDFGYAVGIGEYGGQDIRFINCNFHAYTYTGKQLAGLIWHSRDLQEKSCYLKLETCYSEGGNFGARLVSYNSTQNDTVEINHCKFKGIDGDYLVLNNTTTTKWWGRVIGQGNEIDTVFYNFNETLATEYRLECGHYSANYIAYSSITKGDVVVYADLSGYKIQTAPTTTHYKTVVGIALNSAVTGEKVVVQRKGFAKVTTTSSLVGQDLVGNSITNAGKAEKVTDIKDAFGVALMTTTANSTATVLLALNY